MTQSKQTQATVFAVWLIAVLLAVAGSIYADTTGPTAAHKLTWYTALDLGVRLKQAIPLDTKANIKRQLKAEWYRPFDVHVYDKPGTKRKVKNCEEFFAALDENVAPIKWPEFSYYIHFGQQCHAIKVVVEGKDAKRSFISGFKFDESIIDIFPPQLAMLISREMIEKANNDKTITSWRKAGRLLSIEVENAQTAHTRSTSSLQDVHLLAKGDFNDDGYEDILVMTNNSAIGGSAKTTGLVLLTRKSADPMFELVKEYEAYRHETH